MDVERVADEVFAVLGTGEQVASFSARHPEFSLADAYRITAAVRKRREARGERVVGRKIGFTNRTIWDEYNVHAPIWGYVYDRTVHNIAENGAEGSLTGLVEPRIEPEIVFGLASAPTPGMRPNDLLGCLEWIAHGFEVVQSIFPGWAFSPADTVAACGLHGALWIGPRHSAAERRDEWGRALAAFDIELFRNGSLLDRGRAANVLDGPVFALRHLVEVLNADPVNPPLAAGEIITTGTLTRAFQTVSGDVWSTRLTGVALEGARLAFV